MLSGCNNHSDSPCKAAQGDTTQRIDSLKWLFYAYTSAGKALFKKNGNVYEFKPVECEVKIERVSHSNDSSFYSLKFYRDGYEYKYIQEGLMVYGFIYFKGVFKPLTGMIELDDMDTPDLIKKNNIKTDSTFKEFLKTIDPAALSGWLLSEAKKRTVFR